MAKFSSFLIIYCCLFYATCSAQTLYEHGAGNYAEIDQNHHNNTWGEVPIYSYGKGYRYEQIMRVDEHSIETYDHRDRRIRFYLRSAQEERQRMGSGHHSMNPTHSMGQKRP